MKKLPMILLTAGTLLVPGLLAIRVVQLEHRLAATEDATEDPQAAPRSPAAVKSSDGSQLANPLSSKTERPDRAPEELAAELTSARAEVVKLKQEVAAYRAGQVPSGLVHLDPTPIEPGGLSTGFVPAGGSVVIEHWTGGDKRRWGHEQAAGAPDTQQPGDIPSAWASKAPDGGEEWLQLDYDRFVDLQQINVVESHNPGAISKVVAMLSNGREATIWEGTMDPSASDELVSSAFPVSESVRARSVKVYLDTTRVPGWNEIDAVEIVGRDGSKQWASSSRASSSYADP